MTAIGENCSTGGVFRDHNGSVVLAFSSFIGKGSNNVGEAFAILQGLQLCHQNGWKKIIIETDSLLVVNCLKKIWQPPLSLVYVLRDSLQLIQDQMVITHIYREANMMADQLAAEAHKHKGKPVFRQIGSFSQMCQDIALADRDGRRYFRS